MVQDNHLVGSDEGLGVVSWPLIGQKGIMEFISFASWRKDNQDLEAQLKDEGFECYACHAEGTKECPTCGHDDPCEICNGEGWIVEPTGEDLKHGMFAAYEEQKKADLERWRHHATR